MVIAITVYGRATGFTEGPIPTREGNMNPISRLIVAAGLLAILLAGSSMGQSVAASQSNTISVQVYRALYLPPDDLMAFLGTARSGDGVQEFRIANTTRSVEIRRNQPANLIVLTGEEADVALVLKLLKEADIAPRQIEIEVKIIELNTTKARNIGLDWSKLFDGTAVTATGLVQGSEGAYGRTVRTGTLAIESHATEFLKLIDSTGTGSVRTAPRVVTVNNRPATILDGKRTTYVTRYSAYSNLYETDSMDAGLTLRVTPSLGESGYLTLKVSAELTELENNYYMSSPVKDGQIVENTVVVRDGESVLLGGRTKQIEIKSVKRLPILGWVIPYLFSRHVSSKSEVESFIILTPHVIDLATTLDPATKAAVEGK
jgi:type III secretion protein C